MATVVRPVVSPVPLGRSFKNLAKGIGSAIDTGIDAYGRKKRQELLESAISGEKDLPTLLTELSRLPNTTTEDMGAFMQLIMQSREPGRQADVLEASGAPEGLGKAGATIEEALNIQAGEQREREVDVSEDRLAQEGEQFTAREDRLSREFTERLDLDIKVADVSLGIKRDQLKLGQAELDSLDRHRKAEEVLTKRGLDIKALIADTAALEAKGKGKEWQAKVDAVAERYGVSPTQAVQLGTELKAGEKQLDVSFGELAPSGFLTLPDEDLKRIQRNLALPLMQQQVVGGAPGRTAGIQAVNSINRAVETGSIIPDSVLLESINSVDDSAEPIVAWLLTVGFNREQAKSYWTDLPNAAKAALQRRAVASQGDIGGQ